MRPSTWSVNGRFSAFAGMITFAMTRSLRAQACAQWWRASGNDVKPSLGTWRECHPTFQLTKHWDYRSRHQSVDDLTAIQLRQDHQRPPADLWWAAIRRKKRWKVKKRIVLREIHLRTTRRHLSNGITQCYLLPDRGGRPAFNPTGQVGTRFIDPIRMKGWVGLDMVILEWSYWSVVILERRYGPRRLRDDDEDEGVTPSEFHEDVRYT